MRASERSSAWACAANPSAAAITKKRRMRPMMRRAGWRMAIPLGECDAVGLPHAVIRDTRRSFHVALVLVLVLRAILFDAGLALGVEDLLRAVLPQLRCVYVPGALAVVHVRARPRPRPGIARHRPRARVRAGGRTLPVVRADRRHERRAGERDHELALGGIDDEHLVLVAGGP